MALEHLIRARSTINSKVLLVQKCVAANGSSPLSQGMIRTYIEDPKNYESKLDTNLEKISKEVDDANMPSHEKEYLMIIHKIATTKGDL
ncbi:unnamed protein product, partial [Allacma fusca]